MPIVTSKYKRRPFFYMSGHLETIIPSATFKIEGVEYQRERLELADGDFLDLDWLQNDNKRLIVLSHGLEGSSSRHYVMRPAKFFHDKDWDILAWNNRSCSGEMNRLPVFYHHGNTTELDAVLQHAFQKEYEEIILIGYSMGGAIHQRYLGEKGDSLDTRIKGAVSLSSPCHVGDSAESIAKGIGKIYDRRFLKKLKNKVKIKSELMELPVDLEAIENAKTFEEFDFHYSIKTYGYDSVKSFHEAISSYDYLQNISVPILILNAKNDPMLKRRCYPEIKAIKSKLIHLEMPKKGGHVGFTLPNDEYSYMEYAAERFINETILPFASPQILAKQN